MYKTKLLSAVLALLQDAVNPLSIAEITQQLAAQDLTPNKTSLYRLLEKLKHKQAVQALQIAEGVTHYELKTEPHGHFMCQQCTSIECVQIPPPQHWINEIKHTMPSQSLESLSFTLQGTCTKCTS